MKIDFAGRAAIVTGASSGIGAAYAKALAEQGADVAILARRVQKLEAVAKECEAFGAKCLPVACDVTDEESIKAAVKQVADAFGHIDILLNMPASASSRFSMTTRPPSGTRSSRPTSRAHF